MRKDGLGVSYQRWRRIEYARDGVETCDAGAVASNDIAAEAVGPVSVDRMQQPECVDIAAAGRGAVHAVRHEPTLITDENHYRLLPD